MNNNLLRILQQGLHELGLNVPEPLQHKLILFIELLYKWNQVHNLTAIKSKEDMVVWHLLDSLVAVPFIQQYQDVLDVGTGAGIPGIPLAVVMPAAKFTLVDSRVKKVTFVQHAIGKLQLSNVKVLHSRIEDIFPDNKFSLILSRAFSSLTTFVNVAKHLCRESGCIFLAYKSECPEVTKQQLPAGWELEKVQAVVVPKLGRDRYLVFVRKMQGGGFSG